MNGTPPAGWEALNDRQTGLLLEQRREIELAEAGILNNAQTLLGADTINTLSGLVNAQTLTVFRDQDRWKKVSRSSPSQLVSVNNELFKTSASWAGIRSQLDAEDHCELAERYSQSKSKTPTASRLEFKEMKTYGGMPMTDEVVVVTCSMCQKPMIPSAFKEHRGKCKPPESDALSEAPLLARTDTVEKKSDVIKSKKRKESVAIEEPEVTMSASEMTPPPSGDIPEKKSSEKKQKIAKVAKVKPVGRVKGPLDLDKQCGVVIAVGAPPCARSLTCKSHSMSSKRAVEGRSKPYDVLLGQVQKKPIPVKDEKASRLASEMPLVEKEDQNLDSDEEFNELLDAVKSYEPLPLAVRPMTYIRRRNNCLRIRDLFLDALKCDR
ncbi:hypothetical protein BGZ94_008215 [Podila epigama]|nr:hypothetical protein BGZ94_008215 [Podila epigama]